MFAPIGRKVSHVSFLPLSAPAKTMIIHSITQHKGH